MTALTASLGVSNMSADVWSMVTRPGGTAARTVRIDFATLSDEELIDRSRNEPARRAQYLDELFGRVKPKVATWCLRFCGDREEAADLSQEVILRAYQRLDSFRLESRFTTWLYTLMRRLAVDQGLATNRRESVIVSPIIVEAEDQGERIDETLTRERVLTRLRDVMARHLAPRRGAVDLPLRVSDRSRQRARRHSGGDLPHGRARHAR